MADRKVKRSEVSEVERLKKCSTNQFWLSQVCANPMVLEGPNTSDIDAMKALQ
jgi:hypothetical protein